MKNRRGALVQFSLLATYGLICAQDANAVMARACNGCTESQIMSQAELSGVAGDRYIYDLPGNSIHHISVECEPISGGKTCYGYEEDVDSKIVSTFNAYRGAWQQNSASESFATTMHVDLPSGHPTGPEGESTDDGYVDAYDTLTIAQLDDNVVNYLNNPVNYSGFYATVVGILTPYAISPVQFDKLSMVVNVLFHDGSKRTFVFNKTTRTYEPQADSARDSHGNQLAEKAPLRGTTYYYGPDPTSRPYDSWNMDVLITGHVPPDEPTCYQQFFDGATLTCKIR